MKRILVAIFSMVLLFGIIATTEVLAEKSNKISVRVDGNNLTLETVNVNIDGKKLEADVPAINYKGNSLVSVRFLAEKLGAKVEWDDKSHTAIIKTSDKTIEMKENSSNAIVNGKSQEIPNGATIKLISTPSSNARTMAPIRFIAETIGAKVEWVESNNTANINSNKNVETPIIPEKEEAKANQIKSITMNRVESSSIPQIHIDAEKEISYKNVLSTNDTIIIMDIEDAVSKEVNLNVDNNIIKNIKATQLSNTNDKKIVRVTIELKKFMTSEIKKDKNSLKINFLNELEGIEKQTINGKEAIVTKSAYASKSNSFLLSNPERLVVDMRNTNLKNTGSHVNSDIVKDVRISQYAGKEYDPTEKIARVVFDISENYENPKFITEERGDDLIIYIEGTKKPSIPNNSEKQRVIVIDPGHGGHDGGTSHNGVKEKDLALRASLMTRDKLEGLGYKVLMTRTTDVYPSYADRYNLANNNNADAFISIHLNGVTDIPTATGIETLYSTHNSKSKSFAQSIQSELIKETKARDRGLKLRNGLAVFRGTKGISALAELGFISNPNDVKEIVTDSYLEKCATAIANGVHRFFQTNRF